MLKRRSSWFAAGSFLAGAVVLLLIGCVTHKVATKVEQQDDIAEYQQITREARVAFDQALRALDAISAYSNTCPAAVVTSYQQEVQNLEVEAIKIRSRAHAVLSRGDAYFEHWQQNLAKMKSDQARQLAEARHLRMLEAFSQIKTSSSQVRDAFRPFLADLRKLRILLENDPNCVATEPTRALMAAAQARAPQLRQHLESTQQQLEVLATLVKPIKAAAKS